MKNFIPLMCESFLMTTVLVTFRSNSLLFSLVFVGISWFLISINADLLYESIEAKIGSPPSGDSNWVGPFIVADLLYLSIYSWFLWAFGLCILHFYILSVGIPWFTQIFFYPHFLCICHHKISCYIHISHTPHPHKKNPDFFSSQFVLSVVVWWPTSFFLQINRCIARTPNHTLVLTRVSFHFQLHILSSVGTYLWANKPDHDGILWNCCWVLSGGEYSEYLSFFLPLTLFRFKVLQIKSCIFPSYQIISWICYLLLFSL